MVLAIPCGKALNSFFELKAVDKWDNFLSLMRNSTVSVCEKPCNFFSVLLNAAVLTTRVQVHNQFIFTVKADIQMFEMKITVM